MPDFQQLMKFPNRPDYEQAVVDILQNPEDLDVLFTYFTSGSTTDRNRSAWLLQHISDAQPQILISRHRLILQHAHKAQTDAEKRFIARLFAKHGLPQNEEEQGLLLNLSFDWLISPKESIAVKANCLDVLHRFCAIHPEVESELRNIIEDQYHRSTAAFKVRAKRILNDLNPVEPKGRNFKP